MKTKTLLDAIRKGIEVFSFGNTGLTMEECIEVEILDFLRDKK